MDPIRFEGGDFNLYGYLRNNSLKYLDPKGTKILWLYISGVGHSEPADVTSSNFGDLWNGLSDRAKNIRCNDCVRVIEIGGHGTPDNLLLHDTWGTGNSKPTGNGNAIGDNTVEYFAANLIQRLPLCPKCFIILSGCNVGLLKNKTLGCKN